QIRHSTRARDRDRAPECIERLVETRLELRRGCQVAKAPSLAPYIADALVELESTRVGRVCAARRFAQHRRAQSRECVTQQRGITDLLGQRHAFARDSLGRALVAKTLVAL